MPRLKSCKRAGSVSYAQNSYIDDFSFTLGRQTSSVWRRKPNFFRQRPTSEQKDPPPLQHPRQPHLRQRTVQPRPHHCPLARIQPLQYQHDIVHSNHHIDRFALDTNRNERCVGTSGLLSFKIVLRGKHTTTHGEVSRRLLPEFKTV